MSRSTPSLGSSQAFPPHEFAALYAAPLPATRGGPLYGAFPYPTKISPEAIALYVAAHTKPGDTVFDGFAGSGTTGLAALLCEDPPSGVRREAARRGLSVEWGPRNAVLYEIGALGAFISRTLTNPPNPAEFRDAAEGILRSVQRDFGWLYSANDPHGGHGTIRYLVWTDIVRCASCGYSASLWEACVSLDPAKVDSAFRCAACDDVHPVGSLPRVTERVDDDLTETRAHRRLRRLARVHGVTGSTNWTRAPNEDDLELLRRVEGEPLPGCVPDHPISWGDLYRAGYHQGISHVHQFYTRRNLIAFGRLWERADTLRGPLRDAVRFWLLSYNASHATIMTRVVAKSGQKDLAVTSAQPGVLYVSGLPVEKNIFLGLRRKLSTITKAFQSLHGRVGQVSVHQRSSCAVDLPDCSIDYAFTDPPFGANIPYSELSLLNEAWLGAVTDPIEEAIISPAQTKTVAGYQALLTSAFAEVHRILKPRGHATLVFHSATAEVWNALRNAYTDAGLSVEHAGILDKRQGSFKQVTTDGAVRGDPVLLLGKRTTDTTAPNISPWRIAAELNRRALGLEASERTPERLYARFVSHFLARHQDVPINAGDFYRWHAEQQATEARHARG